MLINQQFGNMDNLSRRKNGINLLVVTLTIVYHITTVTGHGRLIEPPSRATMWRYGFDSPPNYNDHELYCGGFSRQWQTNKGKCGVCGDPWDMPKPRPHEAGGKYANGIMVRKYKMDSSFTIRVELTANHKGYFEFRLCPHNSPHKVVSQACLDKYILQHAHTRDGKNYGDEPAVQDPARYYPPAGSRVFEMRYMLPKGLTCTQCVLQWRYFAGNNWGMCANGTGQVGCGPQEEFRACADVSVLTADGSADGTPFDNELIDEEQPTDVETDQDDTVEIGTWWLWFASISFGALLFVITSFFILQFCFNNKNQGWLKNGKKWMKCRWGSDSRFTEFWKKTNSTAKDLTFPQPVAPPRNKRIITNEI